MCQFCSCRTKKKSENLFQPIASATAATIRAGWWAYSCQNSPPLSGYADYSSYQPSQTFSPASTNTHNSNIPTYDYGYGADF